MAGVISCGATGLLLGGAVKRPNVWGVMRVAYIAPRQSSAALQLELHLEGLIGISTRVRPAIRRRRRCS